MFAIQKYEKGERIQDKGSVVEHHWYIYKSLIKGFDYIKKLEKEVILNFLWEGTFLSLDVHYKICIPVNVEVVKDVTIYKIT